MARARLLATCPDATYRDGKLALADATKACQETQWTDASCLDVLAAAHAEVGDFASAVQWEEKALDLASEADKVGFQSRLDLYKNGKPYREEIIPTSTSGTPVPEGKH